MSTERDSFISGYTLAQSYSERGGRGGRGEGGGGGGR